MTSAAWRTEGVNAHPIWRTESVKSTAWRTEGMRSTAWRTGCECPPYVEDKGCEHLPYRENRVKWKKEGVTEGVHSLPGH